MKPSLAASSICRLHFLTLTRLFAEPTVESARFSPAPTKHVYALSPSAPTVATLAASSSLAHPSTSKAAGDDPSSWKPAPVQGYGTITHPNGPRKRAPTAKGAKPPLKSTTAPTAAAQKAGAAPKADAKGKGKEPAKAGGMASLFAKPTKAAPAARPIGQLGGLFAPRDPPPPPKEKEAKKGKEKVVPSKRKVEEKEKPKEKPKPVKKVSNGVFDDEVDDDDDDLNEEDEAALLEMEQAESQGKSEGKSAKGDAAKQKKDLEASRGLHKPRGTGLRLTWAFPYRQLYSATTRTKWWSTLRVSSLHQPHTLSRCVG